MSDSCKKTRNSREENSASHAQLLPALLVGYCLVPQLEYLLYFLGVEGITGKGESVFATVVVVLTVVRLWKTRDQYALFGLLLAGSILDRKSVV